MDFLLQLPKRQERFDAIMVVVDGKVLMNNRVLTTMDEAEVVREARRRKTEIVERAGVKLTQRWPVS